MIIVFTLCLFSVIAALFAIQSIVFLFLSISNASKGFEYKPAWKYSLRGALASLFFTLLTIPPVIEFAMDKMKLSGDQWVDKVSMWTSSNPNWYSWLNFTIPVAEWNRNHYIALALILTYLIGTLVSLYTASKVEKTLRQQRKAQKAALKQQAANAKSGATRLN